MFKLFLLLSLLPFGAVGQIDPSAVLQPAGEKGDVSLDLNPYLYSFKGSLRLYKTKTWKDLRASKIVRDRVCLDHFNRPESRLCLERFRPALGASKKLVFNFPGIFSNGKGSKDHSLLLAETFARRGFTVVTIPNPFTKKYFSFFSQSGGDVLKNARLIRGILKRVLKLSGDISQLHFTGFSYGAFLAAVSVVMASKDSSFPQVNSLMLSYPPLDILHSSKMFDHFFHETYTKKKVCRKYSENLVEQVKFLFSYRSFPVRKKSDELEYCSDFIFFNYFQNSLKSYMKKVLDKKCEEPCFGLFGSYLEDSLDSWKLRGYREQGLTLLGTWLGEALRSGTQVKTVLSLDDPINFGNYHLAEELAGEVYAFRNGGHGGYAVHDEYFELLGDLLEAQ